MLQWARGSADVAVWLITCKHHDTFKQAIVDKLVATLTELLDFSRTTPDLYGTYSKQVLSARDMLLLAYRTLSTRISSFAVRIAYVSRGDAETVGDAVLARANQAGAVVRDLFGHCDASFQFVGSSELVALSRRTRRYSLELPFIECFAHGDKYVLLSRLEDYSRFVRDEDGDLRRYLFDSNVRDFAGFNRVNEDIAESLRSQHGPDFWWLNNGITILVTKAIITGKALMLDDVQIVNGLQTTESLARYFAGGGRDPEKRAVLIKVIRTDDPAVRDAIIRATNNQTEVEQQSLHATDKIQRDIEDVLFHSGWYYDRRKNYYANQGYPQERVVSPLYVAAAVVGVLLRSPSRASVLKQKFMRQPDGYDQVFSETIHIGAWPKLVSVLKYVDVELGTIRHAGSHGGGERFLRRWRHLIALVIVARAFGRYSFSSGLLADLDLACLSRDAVRDVWRIIGRQPDFGGMSGKKILRPQFVKQTCGDAASEFGLSDVESVEVNSNIGHSPKWAGKITDEFLNRVDSGLPTQPWKSGVHREIATVLGCNPGKVLVAIEELVARGRRNRQKDGVVFDDDGNVIAIDQDRAGGRSTQTDSG